jgi:hypothetical protein
MFVACVPFEPVPVVVAALSQSTPLNRHLDRNRGLMTRTRAAWCAVDRDGSRKVPLAASYVGGMDNFARRDRERHSVV